MKSHWLISLILFCFIHYSSSTVCDSSNPCPFGSVCRYLSYLPGIKACVNDRNKPAVPRKRSGRCPTAGFIQIPGSYAEPCNSHLDCPSTKRCCPLSFGGVSACVDQQTSAPQPAVVAIIEGSATQESGVFNFVGSSTLIQSSGFNMLVDTSAPRKRTELLQGLWQKAGLTPEDIDLVITTHGHPDHYSNDQTFSDTQFNFNAYSYTGSRFFSNPLAGTFGSSQRYFLNNDPNVEVIKTPGHTAQCTSVLVRNVGGLGTVAVVGDLFLYKNDGMDQFATEPAKSHESRKNVVCVADYIVPGHGPMFQVDDQFKASFGCQTWG